MIDIDTRLGSSRIFSSVPVSFRLNQLQNRKRSDVWVSQPQRLITVTASNGRTALEVAHFYYNVNPNGPRVKWMSALNAYALMLLLEV